MSHFGSGHFPLETQGLLPIPGPHPREKPPGLCAPPSTGTAFGTWTPALDQKVKGPKVRTAAREPYAFSLDPKTREAVLGVGQKRSRWLPSSSSARGPARLRRALRFCASGLAADPPEPRPRERGPIRSAPVSGPVGIGEQGPSTEIAREDIARSGVFSAVELRRFPRGPGEERVGAAAPYPTQARPELAGAALLAPAGRRSGISLIFMGVNREAPSISVHCGRLVGLE